MTDTIQPFVGARVLEFGAGVGNLTRILCPTRNLYVASDINNEHLARLSNRLGHYPHLEVHTGNLARPDQFELYRDRVDTTVCLNVLEHIEDDLNGLATMRQVLAPGGRAIVLVPEGKNIYGSLDRVLGHYRRYSAQELTDKMRHSGFEVEKMLLFNRISRPGWFVTARILKKETISPTQLKVFDRLVWMWRRIDRFLPWAPEGLAARGGSGSDFVAPIFTGFAQQNPNRTQKAQKRHNKHKKGRGHVLFVPFVFFLVLQMEQGNFAWRADAPGGAQRLE